MRHAAEGGQAEHTHSPIARARRESSPRPIWRRLRRVIVMILGITVVMIGVVMIVTPGPAIVVIPLGLAMLGVRFESLRSLARRVKQRVRRFARRRQPATSRSRTLPCNRSAMPVRHDTDSTLR